MAMVQVAQAAPPAAHSPRSPRATYQALVEAGDIRTDPAQQRGVDALERLHRQLAAPPRRVAGWRIRLGLAEPPSRPGGVYLWGEVGRGKSMLMDLFFADAPPRAKRRVHFHAFMAEIHDRLHARRQAGNDLDDALPAIAAAIAKEASLLCFDEFQVTDVADAMILGRLFTALFAEGVTVVATSNTAPDDLYRDGLQRDRFLPFIALLKERLEVVEIAGEKDHRRVGLIGERVYHYPLGPASREALERLFRELADGTPIKPRTLTVKGRRLEVSRAADRIGWFSFDELCGRPLGASDYLAVAGALDTVFLEGTPLFTEARRNEARRFIALVDALYDARVRLVVSADAAPDGLFEGRTHAQEFRRTASRLIEMQSRDYLAAADRAAAA